MNLSNLLRRTLVQYSRCSDALTLPAADMEDYMPDWMESMEPFYDKDLFSPETPLDPDHVSFPVFLKYHEDQTISLINEETGTDYSGKGLVFHDICSEDEHGQLMESWDGDKLVATVIVPDEVFAMVQPLGSMYDQFDALTHYCLLPKPKKSAVKKFLTDPEAAAGLFHCLCYLASNFTGMMHDEQVQSIPEFADTFNREFARNLGVAPVDPEEISTLVEIMELHELENVDELYSVLAFCACINHCSRFQERDDSLMNALYKLDEERCVNEKILLQWCCNADVLQRIVREALPLACRNNSRRAFYENLLLESLGSEIPLPRESIEVICAQLFCDTLTQNQQDRIGSILKSANGDSFWAVIRQKYQQQWEQGRYLHAMVCTYICNAGENTVPMAEALMLDSQEKSDALAGAAVLIRHLWTAKCLPVTLKRENQITQKLSQWLRTSSSICGSIAGKLNLVLKVTCAISRKDLCEEEIINNACDCFCGEDQELGLCVLGTLPLSLIVDGAKNQELLREELEWNFRKALDADDFLRTVLLFRACVVSGCWDKTALLYNARSLAAAEVDYRSNLTPLEKHLMAQTREELFTMQFSGGVPTSETAWDCLTSPLSAAERFRLEEIQRKASQKQDVLLATSEDVMLVLQYLRNNSKSTQAAALAEYCTPAKDVSDSCLVSWFWILCCWNRREEAMAFYLAHRTLLDRPCRITDEFSHSLSCRNLDYHIFLNTESRMQMGIYLAALLTHSSLVNDFLHSGLMDGSAVENAANVFMALSQCRLPAALKFLSNRNVDLVEDPDKESVRRWILQCMLPDDLLDFWRICWDDRGITRLAIVMKANAYSPILSLGYSGEKEIVIAAVSFCHKSVSMIAPHLLKDDEVALTALTSSSLAILDLHAPILRDHELVLSIIRKNNVYPPLNQVPDWLCDNKEFVMRSLQRRPNLFFLASSRLRADAQVLMAAMEALHWKDRCYVCNLLREADPALRANMEVMSCAVRLYPDSLRMAEEVIRNELANQS